MAATHNLGQLALTLSASAALILWLPFRLPCLTGFLFPKGRPLQREPRLQRKLRLVIIGAGVGGTALGCWLRDLYGEDLELTVVSDGPPGGRCQTIVLDDGKRYEAGAEIISELNEYMLDFMARLGLKEKHIKYLDMPIGIFDGELVVRDVDPTQVIFGWTFLTKLQNACIFLSRFGFSNLKRLTSLLRHKAAPRFLPLYKMLKRGKTFVTVEALLDGLGPECVALTKVSSMEWLGTKGGLSEKIIDELVAGGMRTNYGGQGCGALHAFVGLVSIAGGFASRCFSIRGGNDQVPQGLLNISRPDRIFARTTAHSVRRIPDHTGSAHLWEVVIEETAAGEAMKGHGSIPPRKALHILGPFDVVVVAYPLQRSCLSFEGFTSNVKLVHERGQESFRRCVTHFVSGVLRKEYFCKLGGSECPPMAVLTVERSTAPFYFIALQIPVDTNCRGGAQNILNAALRGEIVVFKLFAPDVLTDAQLDQIFSKRQGPARVVDWYAYPNYSIPQTLQPFVLDGEAGSLLYLNAIEQTASAMEMSAVSARNLANLVVKFVNSARGTAHGF